MIDERELFERAAARFEPPTDAFDRFVDRRRRVQRNRRITAGVIALLVAAAAAGSLGYEIRSAPPVVQPAPPGVGIFEPMRGWIAYVDQRDLSASPRSLSAADPSGVSPPVRLPIGDDPGAPIAWSSSGDRLLLSDGVVIDGDGSRATIVRHQRGFLQGSFSPDGSTVAYLAGDGSLDAVAADGTGKPSVIAPPAVGGYYEPAWSPDGKQIAFISMGKPATISAVSPDGTGRHVIVRLRGRVGEPGPLVWSPDGSMLAFAQNPSCCDTGQTAIWTVNADGSDLHRITPSDGSWGPTWSPDGQRIAFVRGAHVFTVARDGSDPQRVAAGPVYGYFIAWNPALPLNAPVVNAQSSAIAKRVTLAQPLGPSRGEGKQSLLGICVGHVLPCTLIPDA